MPKTRWTKFHPFSCALKLPIRQYFSFRHPIMLGELPCHQLHLRCSTVWNQNAFQKFTRGYLAEEVVNTNFGRVPEVQRKQPNRVGYPYLESSLQYWMRKWIGRIGINAIYLRTTWSEVPALWPYTKMPVKWSCSSAILGMATKEEPRSLIVQKYRPCS